MSTDHDEVPQEPKGWADKLGGHNSDQPQLNRGGQAGSEGPKGWWQECRTNHSRLQ